MTTLYISKVEALEILDSRGNPTIQATVALSDGSIGSAAVPSGASTGLKEAVELRDGDPKRYFGKGVQKAVAHVEQQIAKALVGLNPLDQAALDCVMIELDGSDNKGNLGANSILSISLSVAKAAAAALRQPLYRYLAEDDSYILPVPYLNILNGGAHANNNLDIQEFMIVPLGFSSFRESIRCGVEVYHGLKSLLNSRSYSTAVGDEGGFAPDLDSNEQALDLICEAIERAGFEAGKEIGIALDAASSELVVEDGYYLESEKERLSSNELIDWFVSWVDSYPIMSIEDGMGEDDWQGWKELSRRLGNRVQLVGDDVFVTQSKILQEGIDSAVANAILIKLNQVGTVTETLEAVRLAKSFEYGVMISHRSGETEDTSIADLAVATSAGQIKSGAPCRSDRTSKYNRLLQIEAELDSRAKYFRL